MNSVASCNKCSIIIFLVKEKFRINTKKMHAHGSAACFLSKPITPHPLSVAALRSTNGILCLPRRYENIFISFASAEDKKSFEASEGKGLRTAYLMGSFTVKVAPLAS